MYHCYVETHIGHKNYINTNLCESTKTSKIKDFNSPRNKPLIILDYWSNNIEEHFHLRYPDNIYIYEKSTTHDVPNIMNTMANHVHSMEQGIISLQDKFIELENNRVK